MEGTFYPEVFQGWGIRALVPDEPDRSYIHDRIYDELVHNIFTDETRDGYRGIIDKLTRRGAEGVVLGCTEIPLLLCADQIPIPSFSTTELHCQAAIDRALADD